MHRLLAFLAFGLAAVSTGPLNEDRGSDRIVGGSVTTIQTYPEMASLLHSFTGVAHMQSCGGTIINNRAILSAAHCFHGHATRRWRVRLGSTNANMGGTVFNVNRIISHPSYNSNNLDNDVGILHLSSTISFGNTMRAGRIAGTNYNLADNQRVWATGWGVTREGGIPSERLRHVQIYSINQQRCVNAYSPRRITLNMLCSGVLGVGGRDQCQGDSGGPLFHNGVVVGVSSFGRGCARPNHPGVNARVSRFATWISNNR